LTPSYNFLYRFATADIKRLIFCIVQIVSVVAVATKKYFAADTTK
jgi:hypothetical protein